MNAISPLMLCKRSKLRQKTTIPFNSFTIFAVPFALGCPSYNIILCNALYNIYIMKIEYIYHTVTTPCKDTVLIASNDPNK